MAELDSSHADNSKNRPKRKKNREKKQICTSYSTTYSITQAAVMNRLATNVNFVIQGFKSILFMVIVI